ncbi:MAG: hypothetical protein ACRD1B_06435 [Thermoanaerobaculia bacterium]
MKTATKKNFHLPLPEALYAELKKQARKRGRPATAVARRAIEAWLRQARRMELSESIASYASRHAGSPSDLDLELESAGLDSWMSTEE